MKQPQIVLTSPGAHAPWLPVVSETTDLTEFDLGLFAGLLVGEGHFGGDGRPAQITLKMHVDHETLFRWIVDRFPNGRLYGPYHHGGRRYFQWMARGPFLRDEMVPLLDRHMSPERDATSWGRYQTMKQRYGT